MARHDDVLARPQGVEPELLGQAGDRERGRGTDGRSGVDAEDAESHPTDRTGVQPASGPADQPVTPCTDTTMRLATAPGSR